MALSMKMLAKYISQVAEIESIEGYTIADVKRISGYPDWITYRKKIRKYGLDISSPVDSRNYKREQKYELLKQAFVQAGNKNRISLDKARQILGCNRNHHARRQLDTMEQYGLNAQSIVAYTPQSQMDIDAIEEAELAKRRQPELLRIGGENGIPVKPSQRGGGWLQCI